MKNRTEEDSALAEVPRVGHLIELAAADPLAAVYDCRTALEALSLATEERIAQVVAAAYGSAYQLVSNHELRARLFNDPWWKRSGKRQPHPDKDVHRILRLVFVFVLRAKRKDKRAYDRAHTYTRALQDAFDISMKPEEIPQLLKRAGGIEKLYDQDVERRAKAAGKPTQEANDDDIDDVNEDDERRGEPSKPKAREARAFREASADEVEQIESFEEDSAPNEEVKRKIKFLVRRLESDLLDDFRDLGG